MPPGMWDLSSQTKGSNPRPLQWKRRLLTTGPPGKSLYSFSYTFHYDLLQDIEYSSLCYTVDLPFASPFILVCWPVYPGLLKHIETQSNPLYSLQALGY